MSNTPHHSADPAPAGLVAFAMACFTFFGIYSGLVKGPMAYPLLACWLLGGFVVQLVVAKGELEHGKMLGGNVFLYFSGFFMLGTACSLMCKTLLPLAGFDISQGATIEGWAWLACTLCLVLWTPGYMKTATAVMGWLIIFTDIALLVLSFKDLGLISGTMVNYLIAYPLLVAGILGIYLCSAMQLNAAFGKEVLKLPPPMIK